MFFPAVLYICCTVHCCAPLLEHGSQAADSAQYLNPLDTEHSLLIQVDHAARVVQCGSTDKLSDRMYATWSCDKVRPLGYGHDLLSWSGVLYMILSLYKRSKLSSCVVSVCLLQGMGIIDLTYRCLTLHGARMTQ